MINGVRGMDTIEDFRLLIEKEQNILIYGAGHIANLIHDIMRYYNMQSKICAYVVKDKKTNPASIDNVPVLQVEECITENKSIIIALAYDKQEEVYRYLTKAGFNKEKIICLNKEMYQTILDTEKDLFDSKNYWDQRYISGGNSGSGSYNRLAEFKASIINEFIENENINCVIEWGCGDGNQLKLANYKKYTGYDVSPKAIEICREKFKDDLTKEFICCGDEHFQNKIRAELVLSLDVIFHLVEDDIFEQYMKRVFESSKKYVCIYSSNFNEQTAIHVKHRKFTDWIECNMGNKWKLEKVVKNIYPYSIENPDNTSVSDFYFYKLNCE